MSFSTPILTTSSEICALAAPGTAANEASAPATSNADSLRFMLMCSCCLLWFSGEGRSGTTGSGMRQTPRYSCSMSILDFSSRGAEALHDLAMLHHVELVRERRGETEILLDHDDGEALLAQHPHGAGERLHDHRREAFGDLVEQQQARAGSQDARDREHLLLAARQPRARGCCGARRGWERACRSRRAPSRRPPVPAAA